MPGLRGTPALVRGGGKAGLELAVAAAQRQELLPAAGVASSLLLQRGSTKQVIPSTASSLFPQCRSTKQFDPSTQGVEL